MYVLYRLGAHLLRMCSEKKFRGGYEQALVNHVLTGRQAIQTIFTYVETQLPFAYTHTITLMVKVWRGSDTLYVNYFACSSYDDAGQCFF